MNKTVMSVLCCHGLMDGACFYELFKRWAQRTAQIAKAREEGVELPLMDSFLITHKYPHIPANTGTSYEDVVKKVQSKKGWMMPKLEFRGLFGGFTKSKLNSRRILNFFRFLQILYGFHFKYTEGEVTHHPRED